jgi:lipopolysaccharide transport system permease protein
MVDLVPDENALRRAAPQRGAGFGALRLIKSIVRRRYLVLELARREMTDMHAGQVAGAIWLAVHPLLMFAVYAFLFTIVFKVRIGVQGPKDYLIYLFSGLAPWLVTQDVMVRASGVMIANLSIVKKVMFPPEVLVAKTVLSSVAVQAILFSAVVIYTVFARSQIPASFLLLLPLVVLHLALLWGLSLLLAAMTPFFRDIPELVRVFVTVNVYLMPIVYLPDMVPSSLRFILLCNPFSYLIWCYQDALYFGAMNHPIAWVVLPILSAASLLGGSYVFVRLQHYFANVL